jgi:hypothetical protein
LDGETKARSLAGIGLAGQKEWIDALANLKSAHHAQQQENKGKKFREFALVIFKFKMQSDKTTSIV